MDYVIKLSKEYTFEGKKYTQIDLSKLEDMTTMDMMEAQRAMQRAGVVSTAPQTTLPYCMSLAATATGYPIEFFNGLPIKDANAVWAKIIIFFG